MAQLCLTLVCSLPGVGGLFLFLLRQSEREYRRFALYGLGNAGMYALDPILRAWPDLPPFPINLFVDISFTVKDLAIILFAGTLLNAKRDNALRISALAAACSFLRVGGLPRRVHRPRAGTHFGHGLKDRPIDLRFLMWPCMPESFTRVRALRRVFSTLGCCCTHSPPAIW